MDLSNTVKRWRQPLRRTGVRCLGLALGLGLAAAGLVAQAAGALAVGDLCGPAHATAVAPGLSRTQAAYPMPAVTLVRADGKRMALAEALDDGRPVMLNFVYTSCNTICPVTSQVFQQARELLGEQREQLNMVSISIDPEQDTPRKLAAYAKRYAGAGPWAHFTGSNADAVAVQRAFAAWRGDKMNHQPVTFIRGAPGQPWVRLDGFASPEQLVAELRRLGAAAS
jgi:protein SCO1